MMYQTFQNIVGNEKIKKIESLEEILDTSNNDDLFALFRIRQYFQKEINNVSNEDSSQN